jgi:hypothetical protein
MVARTRWGPVKYLPKMNHLVKEGSLGVNQRWAMFLNETGLRGKVLSEKRQSVYEERLAFMRDLTPGDFATVKRQCVLLGEDLSAEEWLSQLELELEVAAKLRAAVDEGSQRGVG